MIEEVQAYRTSDGQLFDLEESAKKHQLDLDFMDVCTQIAADIHYNGMSERDLANGLFDHRKSIMARLVSVSE